LLEATVLGQRLIFSTQEGLFSPHRVDGGTLAMLARVSIEATDKVLDLGCGYGVVGIFAAKQTRPDRVYLIDSDPGAVACAKDNARRNGLPAVHFAVSDGFRNFAEAEFNLILCNPPYHVDFSVPKHFIEKGFNRLSLGGAMYMVTRRERWYREKLRAIFGAVQVWDDSGYFVFKAVKTSRNYANRPLARS
jgi:16S rRNA (guanine1207-N2)-methyltransferase